MAPARMVAFMEKHISQCEECQADPDVRQEAAKIREIVLPPSKVPKPKVVRSPREDIAVDEDADDSGTSEDEEEDDVEAEGDDEDEENGDDDEFDTDVMDEEDEI